MKTNFMIRNLATNGLAGSISLTVMEAKAFAFPGHVLDPHPDDLAEQVPAEPVKYSYSLDEEAYTGTFDTIEDAIKEAAHEVGVGADFWIGEQVRPAAPETWWRAEDWLEHVSVQDDYGGDWADGWDESTPEQRKELEDQIRPLMRAWLERHNLMPSFWNIDNARKYHVVREAGGSYEVEAVNGRPT